MIRLAVNADDFGFARDVNAGIVEAHCCGILTSTTLMANGDAFDHAVQLARATPSLDVGCHLTLIGGDALTGGPLPLTVGQLLQALARRRIAVYEEFAAQVRKIRDAGIVPTHLDTHKHTHLIPAVLRAVAQVSRTFGIAWVRRPMAPFPLSYAWMRMVRGCQTTDHFTGFQLTGRMGSAEMERALRTLPDGFTEFMCHPGHCTAELEGMPTRLKASRERELEALLSPGVRRVIEERAIALTPFS